MGGKRWLKSGARAWGSAGESGVEEDLFLGFGGGGFEGGEGVAAGGDGDGEGAWGADLDADAGGGGVGHGAKDDFIFGKGMKEQGNGQNQKGK
jgi:hypothetical protein